METIINVHYSGEISLKGGNRSRFENILIENIRTAIRGTEETGISKKDGRILIKTGKTPENTQKILDALRLMPGIEWFRLAYVTKPDIREIEAVVRELAAGIPKKTIKVEARRSDKKFHLTSLEINRAIGTVLDELGFEIDLSEPEIRIQIEIMDGICLITPEKIRGIGGLPIGSAGKVLVLLSGGIDSPVASWLMMKRGCEVDYLHVHSYPDKAQFGDSKIPKLARSINMHYPKKAKIYSIPYGEFYKKTMNMDNKYELVLFRRFIIRLASMIAKQHRYSAVITGDSLGQVASQTLENMGITTAAASVPIYRPLITYNKQEIIDVARVIGTYELSVESYKDCCSLVAAKHPATRANPTIIDALEKEHELVELAAEMFGKVDVTEL